MSDIDNTSQMSEENPGAGDTGAAGGRDLVQELMSNIGKVVSDMVKQELDKVNPPRDYYRASDRSQGRFVHFNHSGDSLERDFYNPRDYDESQSHTFCEGCAQQIYTKIPAPSPHLTNVRTL